MTKGIKELDSVQIGDCFILIYQDRIELFRVNRIDGYAIVGEDYVIDKYSVSYFSDEELERNAVNFTKIDLLTYNTLKTIIMQGLMEISNYISSHSYINSIVRKGDLQLEGNGIIVKVGGVDEDNSVYYDLFCSNEDHYQLIDYSSDCDLENCNIGPIEEIRQFVCISKTTAKIANKKYRTLYTRIMTEINHAIMV